MYIYTYIHNVIYIVVYNLEWATIYCRERLLEKTFNATLFAHAKIKNPLTFCIKFVSKWVKLKNVMFTVVFELHHDFVLFLLYDLSNHLFFIVLLAQY